MNKDKLRKLMRVQIKSVSLEQRKFASIALINNLKIFIEKYQRIALFNSLSNEIDLSQLIDQLSNTTKNLFLPISYRNNRIMRFDRANQDNRKQIFFAPDYVFVKEIKWYNLELIIMPLLAVDSLGYRLGQGGGYYDSTIKSEFRPIICGVGYNFQLVPTMIVEPWDLKLDYFVSETKVYNFVR